MQSNKDVWHEYGRYWTSNVPTDERVMHQSLQTVLVEQMCLFPFYSPSRDL